MEHENKTASLVERIRREWHRLLRRLSRGCEKHAPLEDAERHTNLAEDGK